MTKIKKKKIIYKTKSPPASFLTSLPPSHVGFVIKTLQFLIPMSPCGALQTVLAQFGWQPAGTQAHAAVGSWAFFHAVFFSELVLTHQSCSHPRGHVCSHEMLWGPSGCPIPGASIPGEARSSCRLATATDYGVPFHDLPLQKNLTSSIAPDK